MSARTDLRFPKSTQHPWSPRKKTNRKARGVLGIQGHPPFGRAYFRVRKIGACLAFPFLASFKTPTKRNPQPKGQNLQTRAASSCFRTSKILLDFGWPADFELKQVPKERISLTVDIQAPLCQTLPDDGLWVQTIPVVASSPLVKSFRNSCEAQFWRVTQQMEPRETNERRHEVAPLRFSECIRTDALRGRAGRATPLRVPGDRPFKPSSGLPIACARKTFKQTPEPQSKPGIKMVYPKPRFKN